MLVGCLLEVLHVISNHPRAIRPVSFSINCWPVDSFVFRSICGSTASVDLGRFFSFLVYTVSRTPCTGDQPIARPTHRTTQTQNKCMQTSMPRVGFDRTIQVFERAKTVHALHRGATVIGFVFRSPRRNITSGARNHSTLHNQIGRKHAVK
jgi:hypothetical protein